MVIRSDEGTLCLTRQPEHARLSGQLVAAWGGGDFAPAEPLGSIRIAAEMHDAGWSEVDGAPQIDPETGRPYSFLDIPQDVHTAAHTRTVERARAADPYAGLLTSLHSAGLYRERYGFLPHIQFRPVAPAHQAAVDRFLALQDQIQAELTTSLKPDQALLWTHYRWFQIWDALSLYACMLHPSDVGEQLLGKVPVSPGGPEVAIKMWGAGAGRFAVAPWPFRHPELTLHWQARCVPDRVYESDADFQGLFQQTPLAVQQVTLIPG